jgi:hypothetical protein
METGEVQVGLRYCEEVAGKENGIIDLDGELHDVE